MPKSQHQAPPRDVVAMLHLLSRWLQTQGVQELRIEPGVRGSDEARVTRYVRRPIAIEPTPATAVVSGRNKPRRLHLPHGSPVERTEAITELLPLTYAGGVSGLAQIRLVRRCARCHLKQFIEEFTRQRDTADGRSAYCKPCKLALARRDRARRTGLPDITIEKRLWPRINKQAPGGCWLWDHPDRDGYGHINFRGRTTVAHLVAYELLIGPIPKDKRAHQTCGKRACCNPAHIVFVTNRELSLLWAKDNPFRQKALKTHCHRGQAFTRSNTHHFRVAKAVSRVCLDCLRLRNPGTTKRANRPCDALTLKAGKLLQKAEVALTKVRPTIRDATRSCLTIEILAGQVTLETLPRAVKKAETQAWKDLPDKWKTVFLRTTRCALGPRTGMAA